MGRMMRRITLVLGAVLFAGGWGLTRYLDAQQLASGSSAGTLWREGVRRTTVSMKPSPTPPIVHQLDADLLGRTIDEARAPDAAPSVEQVFQILDESGVAPGHGRDLPTVSRTSQVMLPVRTLYLGGVIAMVAGALLIALIVPLGRNSGTTAQLPIDPGPRLRLRGP